MTKAKKKKIPGPERVDNAPLIAELQVYIEANTDYDTTVVRDAIGRIDVLESQVDHHRVISEERQEKVDDLKKDIEKHRKSFQKLSGKLDHVVDENRILTDERETFVYAIRSMNRIIGKLFHVDGREG